VNLDPHASQESDFEIPLWEWGLPDGGALFVEDLLSGRQFVWRGKIQHLRLELDAPYRLWRVCPAEDQQ
jgi:starch synthase (maltosyl-transferring)